jgi:hypothetical protein
MPVDVMLRSFDPNKPYDEILNLVLGLRYQLMTYVNMPYAQQLNTDAMSIIFDKQGEYEMANQQCLSKFLADVKDAWPYHDGGNLLLWFTGDNPDAWQVRAVSDARLNADDPRSTGKLLDTSIHPWIGRDSFIHKYLPFFVPDGGFVVVFKATVDKVPGLIMNTYEPA